MTKEELIQSATLLHQPAEVALEEFSTKREALASLMNERFRAREDLFQMIGQGNLDMMLDNHRNHIRFMVSLFSDYQPRVLVETVLWVFRAYRAHGFRLTYWPAQLDTWVELFHSELSPGCLEQIYPFYHWMIVNNPHFALVSDEVLAQEPRHEANPYHSKR